MHACISACLPAGAVVLRGCSSCLSKVEQALRKRRIPSAVAAAEAEERDPTSDHFIMIVGAHSTAVTTRQRIVAGLSKYQELIDAIGNGTETGVAGRGTMHPELL